ncbi:hypothetical protein BC936DRAFT_142931 [Jimgerdemannia flammicorona]|uniref:Uncharacterized protein n=1 Tax=Jimgerdemannia flammicorona TaxID=994334 RepID=A0A432ZZL5_9FUNG|nr:hypothetical protein BC936DRAFT_142931 [Jimgerdemannia flammicorona]
MSILTTTSNCYLLDCESAFCKDLFSGSDAWILKPGEFDIREPYFRERGDRVAEPNEEGANNQEEDRRQEPFVAIADITEPLSVARKRGNEETVKDHTEPQYYEQPNVTNAPQAALGGPHKRRKVSKKGTPSSANLGLHEHHRTIRGFLLGALDEARAAWTEVREAVRPMRDTGARKEVNVDLSEEVDFVAQAELVRVVKGFGGGFAETLDVMEGDENCTMWLSETRPRHGTSPTSTTA